MAGEDGLQRCLSEDSARQILSEGLAQIDLRGRRVLIIIPDGTSTAPIPMLFRMLHQALWGRVRALDVLVALGTHPPMSEEALNRLVGATAEERATVFAGVRILNHRWDLPETFVTLGVISADEMHALSDGRLAVEVPVRINRLVQEYDHLIVCGPVFPHEAAGFSGGNKYFFPGTSGPELIDLMHWLGALITAYEIMGVADAPTRRLIDRAASFVKTPTLHCCMVTTEDGLAGMYVGNHNEAWPRAVELASRLHITTLDRPAQRVLSIMPPIYDDLWTGAKGAYKLEPVVADGGEIVIYAPGITEISYTHGRLIDEVGYHVRDYFVKQWDRFQHYPLGILAHSCNVRGRGAFVDGAERPHHQVTLATGISRERCEKVGLGYMDPATVKVAEWEGRQEEGILVVHRAGETLYRLHK